MSGSRGHSGFVHVHNHSNFSLLDGATRIDELTVRCQELGMRAVALTDHGNMFGAVSFYRKAKQVGLKPIIGMEAYIAPGARRDRNTTGPGGENSYHLLLLARNLEGYRNLMKLSSIGYMQGFYYRPRIDREALAQHSGGLLATTGCLSSEVPTHLVRGDEVGARRALGDLRDIVGADNLYVELQDQGLPEQRRINPQLVSLAGEFDLPLVGTNDCHYLRREDAGAHDVLLCIQTGKGISDPNRMKFPNEEFYLKSAEEMHAVFSEIPDAMSNTEQIAERCNLSLDFDQLHLPRFPVPEGYSLNEYFAQEVRRGFGSRMEELGWGGSDEGGPDWSADNSYREYRDRLDYEMSVIVDMGFAGYFLIVWDFIRFAREAGIPVGPGRGSAAGSLVAYCLGITDVDPLEYGLVFERFLNPGRVSMPDIDIDFCMRRRGEVIEYVANKYGRERVAHIITFGTMAAKAAIRDVGRVLEMSYGDVDRIARMIPSDLDATISGALGSVPALREAVDADPKVGQLVDLAGQLEGQVRHASTHAAGVVIAADELTDYVPMYKPPSGAGADQEHFVVTQYPMGDVEAIGLLKMDFLGLRTLTVVHDTLKSISRATGKEMTTADIPLDDPRTYDLFAQGSTSGIFQFESSGMRDALRKLRPARLEDLIAMNALYRPGPLRSGMIDEFIRRKHDRSRIKYEHEDLEEILRETHGVIVYQEQVMQIAAKLSGFSLAEADTLRKAMGKKKHDVMASMEEKFLAGSRERGVGRGQAKKIWDMIVEFAGYGFNKSHSAAYALLAQHTGYLKANYPVYFMAALLSSERDNTDKVVQHINEFRDLGIEVLPPDVNESESNFTPADVAIRFGLAAVKGVGESAVHGIMEARERLGKFSDLYEFCEEVDLSRGVNKRTIESLVKSGALDVLADPGDLARGGGLARSRLMAQLDAALESGQRRQRDRDSGQTNLFADLTEGEETGDRGPTPMPPCEPWSERELLAAEKESLGFYLTGHPLQRHKAKLDRLTRDTTSTLAKATSGRETSIAGIVVGTKDLKTRKGDRMAVVQVEDLEGRAEVVVFPEVFQAAYALLDQDVPLYFKGKVEPNEDSARMIASEILTLDEIEELMNERGAREVEISVILTGLTDDVPDRLRELLERHRGNIPVVLSLERPRPGGFRARVVPNRYLYVEPTRDLVAEVEELLGPGCVRLVV